MTTYQLEEKPKQEWQRISRPAQIAEHRLISAILDGTFKINSNLPGERELAERLGVTRPTLRETLGRLERDGWVEINQGKPTRVCDYWQEGNLGVLNTLSHFPEHMPEDFIENLLTVRLAMAPTYTAMAIKNAPAEINAFLTSRQTLDEDPNTYAEFDWELHHTLTLFSKNPVFMMILNGFKELYLQLAPLYFAIAPACQHSMHFYNKLAQAAAKGNTDQARTLSEIVMRESIQYWQEVNFNKYQRRKP
ncbi:MAG: fatty acid metabolism transcriptional regulator FadR [Chloroflexi bacterium]|nr:fatty acid metabolism transcriptional regulator FadR [Chloroflexota bacterium]